MHGQEPLFTRQALKSPAVLVFASVYILALMFALRQNAQQALVYAGLSLGLVFLVWLIVELTRKLSVPVIRIRQPALDLLFIGLVFGTLWQRTRSLIPGVIVHAGINALNNLGTLPALLAC